MGREIKRVAMDFDWPIGRVWLPYMAGICTDDVDSILGKKDNNHGDSCEICRHAARLAGVEITSHDCPKWKIDPQAGPGYQMWETTSEGSPMSPVFETPEELARWLSDTNASAFGGQGASYEAWLKMARGPGWAPSAVMDGKGLRSGVEAMADRNP